MAPAPAQKARLRTGPAPQHRQRRAEAGRSLKFNAAPTNKGRKETVI